MSDAEKDLNKERMDIVQATYFDVAVLQVCVNLIVIINQCRDRFFTWTLIGLVR